MMNVQARRILLIDKQEYWRTKSARTLRDIGFDVAEIDDYEEAWRATENLHLSPDLIILGCATIGAEEKNLIQRLLEDKHRVLIFSTSLPWRVMRSLFLLGAEDVADKTYDARHLIVTVEEMLNDSTPKASSFELQETEVMR